MKVGVERGLCPAGEENQISFTFHTLPSPWQTAFEQAWEAYLHGSYPIGACVTDESGHHLSYAASDLWAGHSEALTNTFYPSQRPLTVSRAPAELGRACILWQITFHLDRGLPRDHGFFAVHRAAEPELFAAAERLHLSGVLADLKSRRASPAEGLELLLGTG